MENLAAGTRIISQQLNRAVTDALDQLYGRDLFFVRIYVACADDCPE